MPKSGFGFGPSGMAELWGEADIVRRDSPQFSSSRFAGVSTARDLGVWGVEEARVLPLCPPQVLTEEFRLDYCHLWQSLIWTDMKRVQEYSQRLGAGDLYPLFACMLTARSWDSVNRGISQAPVTATEDTEIRNNAANYLPQISQLLNHVPRQMLLIFKTNDLLRGIEAALGTRASASSFLNMSRCCIRALAKHKKKNTCSFLRRTQISCSEAFSLWQISLHELMLRVKGLRLPSWAVALLCWLFPAPH